MKITKSFVIFILGAHYSLHWPPVGHCKEPLATKQSQANDEIATPFALYPMKRGTVQGFGLAMTFSDGSKCKLFHASLINYQEEKI